MEIGYHARLRDLILTKVIIAHSAVSCKRGIRTHEMHISSIEQQWGLNTIVYLLCPHTVPRNSHCYRTARLLVLELTTRSISRLMNMQVLNFRTTEEQPLSSAVIVSTVIQGT